MVAIRLFGLGLALALASFGSWLEIAEAGYQKKIVLQPGGKPIDLPGLHNVIHVSDRLVSGGSPEGDAGFESLKMLGIKTILSVDGARPDLVRAKKFEMRYIHLPIGYDGVSNEQAMKLAKAVRDLPAPIYIHCHHGKHRSPGAAAAIQICLDDKCTVAQAVDIMKRAGTDPRYAGLYAAPKELKRPTTAELNQLKVEFPEAAEIPALAKAMVHIDQRWEHLTLIKKAGWKIPKDHPDLDPPHEALQLMEHYREMARLPSVQKRPADFKAWLKDGEDAAKAMEAALRKSAKDKNSKPEVIEKAYEQSRQACAQCHAKYRDAPRSKTGLQVNDASWVGKKIITKRLGIQLVGSDGKPVTELASADYTVLADDLARLKVSQQSVEGWFAKSDAVVLGEAASYFTQRIATNPKDDYAFFGRGLSHALQRNPESAIKDYTEAMRLAPQTVMWRNSRGNAFKMKKDYANSLADFTESIRLSPRNAVAFNNAAWLLSVCPIAEHRNGRKAVELATRACELTSWKRFGYIDTLAAAYAETGVFDTAVKYQRLALADPGYMQRHGAWAKTVLEHYLKKMPYREE